MTKFKEGDIAGIGCFVDSCGDMRRLHSGIEQICIRLGTDI